MNEESEKRVNRFINTGIIIDDSQNENNELDNLIQNNNKNLNNSIEQQNTVVEQVDDSNIGNIVETTKDENQFVKPMPEEQVFDFETIMNNTLNSTNEESNVQTEPESRYVKFVVETPDEPTPSFEQSMNNIPVEPTSSFEQPMNNTPVEPTPSFEQPMNNTPVEPTPSFEQTINNTIVEPTPSFEQSMNNTPVEPTPSFEQPMNNTIVEPTPSFEQAINNTIVEPTPSYNDMSINNTDYNNASMDLNQSFNTVENNTENQPVYNDLSINNGNNYATSNINSNEQERKFDYKINKKSQGKNNKKLLLIIIIAAALLIIGVVVLIAVSGSKKDNKNNKEENIIEEIENIEEIDPEINDELVESTNISLITSTENVYNFLSILLTENGNEVSSDTLKNNASSKKSGISYNKGTKTLEIENIKYNFDYYANNDGFYKSFVLGDKVDSILVVISDKGLDKEIKEKIQFLNIIGVKDITVYINTKEKEDSKKLTNLEESIEVELDNMGFNNISVVDKYQSNIKQLINLIKVPTKGEKLSEPFLMRIDDTFQSTGEGMVTQGTISRGQVLLNQEVEIVGINETIKAKVVKLEVLRKKVNSASEGDKVGIALDGITKNQVQRGQTLATPNSINPITNFKAKVYIITNDEGGRKEPIESGYKPVINFVSGENSEITLPKGTKNVKPGSIADVNVELSQSVALEKGTTFTIIEASRTIGYGIIIDVEN